MTITADDGIMIPTSQRSGNRSGNTEPDTESNYGSDFGTDDETTLSTLLDHVESQFSSQVGTLPNIENGKLASPINEDEDIRITQQQPQYTQQIVDENGIAFQVFCIEGPIREPSVEVEYDIRNRSAFSPKVDAKDERGNAINYTETAAEAEEPDPKDERSPIERFRTAPRKPLSVTDIVSPAWCELQYWYSLTKYGRVRRTKAMEQGSSVHKVMEEQAHTKLPVATVTPLVQRVLQEELKQLVPPEVVAKVVKKVLDQEKRPAVPIDVAAGLVHKVLEKEKIAPIPINLVSQSVHKVLGEQVRVAVHVEVATKEDAFGLRIWNIIQALRTLRSTGMTRELEVWAVIDGEVVNGVIDEISYDCPDEALEAMIQAQKERTLGGKRKRRTSVSKSQPTMEAYLSQGKSSNEHTTDAWLGAPHQQQKVYLGDIKTRGSRVMPSGEASLRPTAMQLMMYHRMLSLIASKSVPADTIFKRYNLKSNIPFSDTFIAQIGNLEFNFGSDIPEDSRPFETEQDAIDELLAHNTLEKLWGLMISEYSRTIPFDDHSSKGTNPIGDVLRAEYRTSKTGEVIGTKTFAYDDQVLELYLKEKMAWWRGERPPAGVDIEEAFKCRICEFAERCTWRKEKVEEGLQKARLRRAGRKKSGV